MASLWTQTLIPTARQVPADAEVPSHQLMLRAGLIHRLGSGIYSYLPLGWRSLRKATQIIREEMDHAGAVEVLLPALQPIELWEQSGRRVDYGNVLFVVADQHGRQHTLGPTHEEVITEMVGAHVNSYRALPITLYQIQTKFRDEFRPRFGVLRSREFQMKDAYSFDLDAAGLERSYQTMYDAYSHIFVRCGLPYEVVEAESGPIGGSASHEFMVPSPTGEDIIMKSDQGDYAANIEKCAIGERAHDLEGSPTGELKEVHTPGCTTIDSLCTSWKRFTGGKLKSQHVLKTLVYHVEGEIAESDNTDHRELIEKYGCSEEEFCFNWIAVVRGDHELNESKFKHALLEVQARQMNLVGTNVCLKLMDESMAKSAGFEIGFVGPDAFLGLESQERQRTFVMVDPSAAQPQFWVAGANKADFHRMHFNWIREIDLADEQKRVFVEDIRNAVDGDPSPKNNGGILHETKGIEIGHVFKLGTKYSEALGVSVLDEHNQRKPLVMGCYGIGANRILAATIESDGGHDDHGIIWPLSIAPYAVLITPLGYEGRAREVTGQLAAWIEAAGYDVLIDDRAERPGVKFKDADLIGIPLRITIGPKSLKNDKVELKTRGAETAEQVPVTEAGSRTIEILATLASSQCKVQASD